MVSDPENTAQKNLIDAAVAVGVKRFAPSEWGSLVQPLPICPFSMADSFSPANRKSNSGFPGFEFKDQVHEYLKSINAKEPVLEYCLFQPGSFMNYLSYPYPSAKHLMVQNVGIDVAERHALITGEGDAWQVFTTADDFAKVVARAVDFEGSWPEVGGMVGERIQQNELIGLLEKYTGKFAAWGPPRGRMWTYTPCTNLDLTVVGFP